MTDSKQNREGFCSYHSECLRVPGISNTTGTVCAALNSNIATMDVSPFAVNATAGRGSYQFNG